MSARGGDGTGAKIRLTGCRIKPADQVTLSVNQSGVLDSVPQEGDQVVVGQKVILLEDELARTTLSVAQKEAANDVDIRQAEAASAVARLEYEQKVEVNDRSKGAVSLAEVRRAKLELDRSVLQIEQARHKRAIAVLKRDEAAAQLKTYHVMSPIVGTVNKVLRHKGETVRQGEPIVELVNTGRVRVEGFLDVTHRRHVAPGTAVQVELEPGTGKPGSGFAAGKVVFVDSVVQPVTQKVRFWADVENTDELLLPGLTAVMTILPGNSVEVTGR
jgi:multidrug efflux pump subunit AcrA (membrane-fusion protein)